MTNNIYADSTFFFAIILSVILFVRQIFLIRYKNIKLHNLNCRFPVTQPGAFCKAEIRTYGLGIFKLAVSLGLVDTTGKKKKKNPLLVTFSFSFLFSVIND